ncbi:MAG: OmpA family protein [Polyangiales bacterium]
MRLCSGLVNGLSRAAVGAVASTLLWSPIALGQDADSVGPPWGTAAGSGEIGLYWGAFIPDRDHELYDADRPGLRYQQLEYVTPELGLRGAWFPWRVLGLELEAGLLPTQTRTSNEGVNLWTVRGHAILQAPTKTLVPFLLAGGGVIAISSSSRILGTDQDSEFHVGVGLKAYVTGSLALRLDVRDNFTQGFGAEEIAQHWEALLGLAVVLGRPEPPPPPPPDADGDGFPDPNDQCPQVAGLPPDGCPPPAAPSPPADQDVDGIADAADACPTVAGIVNNDPKLNGCPPPPADADGDGVPDESDRCPTVAGDGPDGCLVDSDADGIPNRDDKCVDKPETVNNFEDGDGCPDELPKAVQKFTGTIAGIAFDTGKATIRASSYKVLDEASKVLVDYPALRVEISGHTDSSGSVDTNIALSKERADSVKAYLVGKGVGSDRVETRGAGPNEPVAPNLTPEGRSKNRRVEFKLLH